MTRLSAVLLLAALASGAAHAQGGPAFAAQSTPNVLAASGAMNAPVIADIDGDGDLDVVRGAADGTLAYYQNQAGAGAPPAFLIQTGAANPFDAITVGYASAPAATDFDGDGDADLMLGDGTGVLAYYSNTAGVFALEAITGLSDVGFNSAPAAADFDRDGDVDLVVGTMEGTFAYFLNTAGSPATPAYAEQIGAANPLNGVDIGFSSIPTASDVDGDGDMDLVAGDALGGLWYVENTAGPGATPVFAAPVLNPGGLLDVGYAGAPAAADFTGDGLPDLLAGTSFGGWVYFENLGMASLFVQLTGDSGYRALSVPYPDLPLGGRLPGFLAPIYTAGYVGADRDQRNVRGLANVFASDEPTATRPRVEKDNPIRLAGVPGVAEYEHGRGLWVYAFSDDDPFEAGLQGGFPKSLPAVGCGTPLCVPLATDFTFPVTLTPASTQPGANLLGNPYNEDIDWDAVGWTKTGISATMEIWDPTVAPMGGFRTWDGAAGTLPDGRIPTGQAFLATATAAGPSLIVPASARTGLQGPIYGLGGDRAPEASRAVASGGHVRFRLVQGGASSEVFVTVREGAALGADRWEAPLREGTASSLRLAALDADGAALVHAALPSDLEAPASVALHAEASGDAAALAWTPVDLPEGWSAVLVDATTGLRHDLTEPGRVALTLSADHALLPPAPEAKADGQPEPPSLRPMRLAAGKQVADARFSVQIGPGEGLLSALPKVAAVSTVGAVGPNPARGASTLAISLAEAADVRVLIYDALGRRVATPVDGPLAEGPHLIALPVARLAAGTYVVRVEGVGAATARRLTVAR